MFLRNKAFEFEASDNRIIIRSELSSSRDVAEVEHLVVWSGVDPKARSASWAVSIGVLLCESGCTILFRAASKLSSRAGCTCPDHMCTGAHHHPGLSLDYHCGRAVPTPIICASVLHHHTGLFLDYHCRRSVPPLPDYRWNSATYTIVLRCSRPTRRLWLSIVFQVWLDCITVSCIHYLFFNLCLFPFAFVCNLNSTKL